MLKNKLFYGGKIYCGNFAEQTAQSLLVGDGRVIYVGDYRDALHLTDADTEFIDLNGCDILPGFVDCRAHMLVGSTTDAMSENHMLSAWGFARFDEFGITTACDTSDFGVESIRYLSKICREKSMGLRCVSMIGNGIEPGLSDGIRELYIKSGVRSGIGDSRYRIGAAMIEEDGDAADRRTEAVQLCRKVSVLLESDFDVEVSVSTPEVLGALADSLIMTYGTSSMHRIRLVTDFPLKDELLDRVLYCKMIRLICPSKIQGQNDKTKNEWLHDIRYSYDVGARVGIYYSESGAVLSYPLWELAYLSDTVSGTGISLCELVRMACLDSAYACGCEYQTGSLEWGKSADFVILSDSFCDTSGKLSGWRVCETYFEGKRVYKETRECIECPESPSKQQISR